MTVRLLEDGSVHLGGMCGADEAEALLGLLIANPGASVDWRTCEGAHTAIVQVLLAAARPIAGPPRDAFLSQWVEPLLPPR